MKNIKIEKSLLEEKYLGDGMSFAEIASIIGCSRETVADYARKFGIQARSGGRKRIDLEGKVFGNLCVVASSPSSAKHPKWKCQCSCGEIVYRTASDLRRPGNKMCWSCRNSKISKIKWKGHGEISGDFWDRTQRSATSRSLSFNISIEFAWNLFLKQKRLCALSGEELMFHRSDLTQTTASIDRIDSTIGYDVDNIQWVHKTVNNLKMDLPQNEFIKWCRRISQVSEKID